MSTPSAFTNTGFAATPGEVTAVLGFAIEPLEAVAAQMAALPATSINATLNAGAMGVTKPIDPAALAERIARHLYNYVSGFVPSLRPESMVPMGIIAKWYENFMGKLRAGGTAFLEREG